MLPDNDLRELLNQNRENHDEDNNPDEFDDEVDHLSDYDHTPAAHFSVGNNRARQARRNLIRDYEFGNCDRYQEPRVQWQEQPQQQPQVQPQIQLQPIYLACSNTENTWGEFDGNLTKWQTFHDCFKSAVHENKTISNVFKFQKLKASLKGKAAQIFNGWEHTDANYQLAWERLKEIYERKYQTSKQLFWKFFNLPKLEHASGLMLEKMSNTTHTVLSQLRSLKYPVQHYDAIFVHALHDRLDPNTSKEWELHRTSETPKLSTMLQFIDWQAQALSNVQFGENHKLRDKRKRVAPKIEHKNEKRAKTDYDKFNNSSKNVELKVCALCKGDHALHRCSKFQKMNLILRRKTVRDNSLCYNCLRSSHMVKDCLVQPCRRCNVKHNSLLCPENPNNKTVTVVQKVKTNERKAKPEKKQ